MIKILKDNVAFNLGIITIYSVVYVHSLIFKYLYFNITCTSFPRLLAILTVTSK
jgi:hypothetical protein